MDLNPKDYHLTWDTTIHFLYSDSEFQVASIMQRQSIFFFH